MFSTKRKMVLYNFEWNSTISIIFALKILRKLQVEPEEFEVFIMREDGVKNIYMKTALYHSRTNKVY